MKYKRFLIFLALALPCAPSAASAANQQARTTIQIPKPPSGKSQVVWFRKEGAGIIVGCSVKENKEKISSLGNGRYFIMVTEPGAHTFEVASEATDSLVLDLKPDETKFAACKISMGIFVGRPKIDLSSEQDFRSKAQSLKMVDPEDMEPARGALRPEQVAAALEAEVGQATSAN